MLFQSLKHSTPIPLHGTYCLNVHAGEAWSDVDEAVRTQAQAVRRRVCPDRPFGLGLRLGARAVQDLATDPARWLAFREYCIAEQLYVFTLNGFPYGSFHGARVKEQVYAPDWTTSERTAYTCRLGDLLAEILPEGLDGSISTVPGSFKPWVQTPAMETVMAEQLAECVAHLMTLERETGREIHLGLEPEPGCYLETANEFINFYQAHILTDGVKHLRKVAGLDARAAEEGLRRHLGVCFDTCHVALQFEAPAETLRRYRSEGIRISKVQISAALEALNTPSARAALLEFDEPVYLHQVRTRAEDGRVKGWMDLPEGITGAEKESVESVVRAHFHVPLFWEGTGPLRSTTHTLDRAFWDLLRQGICPHLEAETYTFDVLPAALRAYPLAESIAQELCWCRDRLYSVHNLNPTHNPLFENAD